MKKLFILFSILLFSHVHIFVNEIKRKTALRGHAVFEGMKTRLEIIVEEMDAQQRAIERQTARINDAIKEALELQSHIPEEDEASTSIKQLLDDEDNKLKLKTVSLSTLITTLQEIKKANINTNIHESIRADYALQRYKRSIFALSVDDAYPRDILIRSLITARNLPSDTIQAHLDNIERSETTAATPLLLERPFGADMAREIRMGDIDETLFIDEWNSSRRS